MGRSLGGGCQEPPRLCGGAGRRGAARDGLSLRRQSGDVRAHRQLQDRPGACAGDPGKARTMSGWSLGFAPLLPWWSIAAFAAAAAGLLGLGIWRRARGTVWRLLACACLALIAAGPSLVEQKREVQRDVAAVVVDESPSMRIGERQKIAADALQAVTGQIAGIPGLELRVIHAGAPNGDIGAADQGTQLYTALARGLADVPRQRIAGAVMISDGEIHDMPPPDRLDFAGPLHVLLAGSPGEADRRLAILDAPKFGLVGKEVQLKL